jgi:hypothetical protein
MDSAKYIGMDVHKETISIAVAQLSDDQWRSGSRDDASEGAIPQLGHCVFRQAGLCAAPS